MVEALGWRERDVIASLSPAARGWLVYLMLTVGRPGHQHLLFLDDGVGFISARFAQDRIGKAYKRAIDTFFVTVDNRFGHVLGCRAYAPRFDPASPDFNSVVSAILGTKRPRSPGRHALSVRLDEQSLFDARPESSTVAGWLKLIRWAAQRTGEPSVIELREGYSAKPKGCRLFATGAVAMQRVPTDLRKQVAAPGSAEIDMVNAQATLLVHETAKPGVYLGGYVVPGMRPNLLNRVAQFYGLDRSEAKDLLLSLMFGATLSGPTNRRRLHRVADHEPWLMGFVKDVEAATRRLLVLKPEFVALARTKHSGQAETKVMRSAAALALQASEARVLQEVEAFVRHCGYQPAVRLFDGLLLQDATGQRPQVDIGELSRWVEGKIGVRMTFRVEWDK